MFDLPVPAFQSRCAISAERQQAVGQTPAFRCPKTVEALAHRHCGGYGHAFPGQSGELLRQPVRFFIFDIQAHLSTILP